MKKDTRRRIVAGIAFFIYLIILASITLMPINDPQVETTSNLIPFTNIDNFVYDIKSNGIINWNYVKSGQIVPSEFFYYAFHYSFRNLVGNILLFLPIGLMYPLCTGHKVSFVKITVIILLITGMIEGLQYLFLSSRSADIDDIILNLIGGIIGYLLFKWIE